MKIKVYLMLLMFPVFTGITFHLAKYSVVYFTAASAAAWRFGIAAVAMILIVLVQKKVKLEPLRENGFIYVLLGIIGIFGFNALFFLGMKHTSAINGALIMATNPLVTVILSRLILRELMTTRQLIGVTVSLMGVIFVITQGSWEIVRTLSLSVGDLWMLLGNLCWALYSVIGRRYVKNSTPLLTTAYTMVVGAVCLIVFSLFDTNPVSITGIPIGAWGAIAFMAIFTSVLGYMWWNQGIAVIGASRTSIFFNLVPIVAMLVSLIQGEPITGVQITGTFLVIGGVLLGSGIRSRREAQVKGIGDHNFSTKKA